MCYTGQCPYEGYGGDCFYHGKLPYPDDAMCVLSSKEEKEESECQNETLIQTQITTMNG